MDLSKEDGDRRNSLPYPMELGSPAFAPVPVEQEKDVILNVGRMHAQQEYDRIMQQVEVLKQQADALQQRLHVSEIMHGVKYGLQPRHGKTYYVYFNSLKNEHWLSMNHPHHWCAGPGEQHTYVMAVKMLGDSTWQEVQLDL